MKLIAVYHLRQYKLLLKYNYGTYKVIDLKRFIMESANPLISKYRNISLFSQAYIDSYGTLCWGDNVMDINPQSILNHEFDCKPNENIELIIKEAKFKIAPSDTKI